MSDNWKLLISVSFDLLIKDISNAQIGTSILDMCLTTFNFIIKDYHILGLMLVILNFNGQR